ncbi:MAG TPA: phosphoribosylanthranilate isomerase [Gemmatimonadales bacterium]|jgi:phosphoribosylanthranilate isomerase
MAVKIKICGLMSPQDAETAAAAGASYLGVVFAGGPRAVAPAQAGQVVAAAAGVPVLGVFGEQSVEEILQICGHAGLNGAQLHGPYSRSDAARLRGAGLRVWRVVRIAAPSDLDALDPATAESDAVLVEPNLPQARGGAGVPLDLAVAKEARCRLAGHPMALAGGLTPDTVAEALALVRPDIVDVSSGVERLPGIKDPNKIARFVEAVFAHSPIT